MPGYSKTIKVPGKSADQIYSVVSKELKKFLDGTGAGKFEVSMDEPGKQVIAKSSYFSATLACLEGEVRLEGSLSFMALPFKGKIDAGIDRWVDQYLKA